MEYNRNFFTLVSRSTQLISFFFLEKNVGADQVFSVINLFMPFSKRRMPASAILVQIVLLLNCAEWIFH